MSASEVVSLIRQHGVGGLGGYDGCACSHFHVLGVYVDVQCRKSGPANTIKVTGSDDYNHVDCALIGDAVRDSVEHDHAQFHGPFAVVIDASSYERAYG